MKIGRCIGGFENLDSFRKAADFGYEFLEIPMAAIANFDAERLMQIRGAADKHGLPIAIANQFFPNSLLLFGDSYDEDAVIKYTDTLLAKAVVLGVKIAVLGSGNARNRPDDMPEEAALSHLADIFGKLADVAAKHDITIVLEPLNTGETNIINTSAEGIDMVERVSHPNFQLLLDFFHMHKGGENTLESVRRAAPILRHCHLAAVPDRGFPSAERMGAYSEFLKALQEVGYGGRLSVECDFKNEAMSDGIGHLHI